MKQLDPKELTARDVEKLWEKISTVKGSYDDRLKDRSDLFVYSLFTDLYYKVEERGLIRVNGIVPGIEAIIHTVIWDKSEPLDTARKMKEVLALTFEQYDLVRCSTSTASVNEDNIRLAKLLGFKEEGRLRKGTLYNGEWFDTVVMGILKEEISFKEK